VASNDLRARLPGNDGRRACVPKVPSIGNKTYLTTSRQWPPTSSELSEPTLNSTDKRRPCVVYCSAGKYVLNVTLNNRRPLVNRSFNHSKTRQMKDHCSNSRSDQSIRASVQCITPWSIFCQHTKLPKLRDMDQDLYSLLC